MAPAAGPPRVYRYYDFIMAAFVAVLLCSNLIGAAKTAQLDLPLVGLVTFSAGVLFFPISYIFGDILTEVYGYGRDRRVVWAGFAALLFASIMAAVALSLPAAPGDFNQSYQAHMEGVFGNTWRIVAGSMIAFWCGSFANSFVMAKMKLRMEGRYLWMRTIGSTLVGEAVDSGLFYFIAFYGIWPDGQVAVVAFTQYVLKTGWEILMTPITYRVVAFLKRKEDEDWYDRNTDFSPFRIKV
jgi:uncharacterized integral membrane protein (TIGR00697 family)